MIKVAAKRIRHTIEYPLLCRLAIISRPFRSIERPLLVRSHGKNPLTMKRKQTFSIAKPKSTYIGIGRSAMSGMPSPTVQQSATKTCPGDRVNGAVKLSTAAAILDSPSTSNTWPGTASGATLPRAESWRHKQTAKLEKKQKRDNERVAKQAQCPAERVLESARQLQAAHSEAVHLAIPKKPRHRTLSQKHHHQQDQSLPQQHPAASMASEKDSLESARANGSAQATDELDVSMERSKKPRFARVVVTTTCCLPRIDASHRDTCDDDPAIARVYVKPLLVLDLNGILCYRLRREPGVDPLPLKAYRPQMGPKIAMTPVISRPDRQSFLEYLDQHFVLAIWTSAKAKTAKALVKLLVPDAISRKLLFVWAQHNCQVDPEAQTGLVHQSDPCPTPKLAMPAKVLYKKDLGQVWKEFPLWNQSNTLLMDDSPNKCMAWQENAVHPPALHGRHFRPMSSMQPTAAVGAQPSLVMSDEENVEWQRQFFERLVGYWKENSTEHDWDWEAGDACVVNGEGHLQFLGKYAGSHMGWHR
jgi:NLI interacting factor-like phosphatase